MLVLLLAAAVTTATPVDLDRDGLDDRLEQALLERFLPTFQLSDGECDDKPASFAPGSKTPRVVARDGTIYGQAFPVAGGAVELHYYHLWSRDCGRGGHALDAEHVSAIVEAAASDEAPDAWAASLWYAAAHEHTVCDASSGAQARTLAATSSGPTVYVSRGKHASYFDAAQCKWGCGGDSCTPKAKLEVARVVNIGERGAPLNGATWVASSRWPLSGKLASDFDATTRARLDGPSALDIVALMVRLRASQSPILAGDTALDALAAAGDSTATALDATAGAVGTSVKATGSALGKTFKGVARFLGLAPKS